ncbi:MULTISPECIES: hypothetical protein [Citricoccus]|uniref:hypothetical protein n=1 Tax=Citricoccus TaxID=169133 RepID=UPI000255E202|nr:hypothetical protein [Citricoccus sp. CH26A]
MYDNPSVPMAAGLAAGTGGLAMTGADVFWFVLAAFALLALGMAILRIVPRRHTAPNAEDHSDAGMTPTDQR